MPGHVFSQIQLHFNWHTDGNATVLTSDVERFVHTYIQNRCKTTGGVFFHEVGGTDDHIHLAVRIEPVVNIAKFIGDLKGSCAFETNKHFCRKLLEWQRGYGVVSFSTRHLKWVVDYIRNQREHHKNGTSREALEITMPEGAPNKPAEAG
jgi:REP element-mobilizing transposase RayT